MERFIDMGAYAASCTLAVISETCPAASIRYSARTQTASQNAASMSYPRPIDQQSLADATENAARNFSASLGIG
jgi:hypothetical protein